MEFQEFCGADGLAQLLGSVLCAALVKRRRRTMSRLLRPLRSALSSVRRYGSEAHHDAHHGHHEAGPRPRPFGWTVLHKDLRIFLDILIGRAPSSRGLGVDILHSILRCYGRCGSFDLQQAKYIRSGSSESRGKATTVGWKPTSCTFE